MNSSKSLWSRRLESTSIRSWMKNPTKLVTDIKPWAPWIQDSNYVVIPLENVIFPFLLWSKTCKKFELQIRMPKKLVLRKFLLPSYQIRVLWIIPYINIKRLYFRIQLVSYIEENMLSFSRKNSMKREKVWNSCLHKSIWGLYKATPRVQKCKTWVSSRLIHNSIANGLSTTRYILPRKLLINDCNFILRKN